MQQCLTASDQGYYTSDKRPLDQFGRKGDFVTSPEISQVFGELVGIWTVAEWMTQGRPSPVRLIEAGPGRGTLMDDVLRTVSRFRDFRAALQHVHLIEASRPLRSAQQRLLCEENKHKIPISWTEYLKHVPATDTADFFLAHEFFDALPIHAFQSVAPSSTLQTPTGPVPFAAREPQWRELMVVHNAKDGAEFSLTLAKAATPHALLLPKLSERYDAVRQTPGSTIEVSQEALSYTGEIARRLGKARGGAALIIDYGPAHTIPTASLRGIRAHQHVSPFAFPGQVDLSADVDFVGLAEAACKASDRVEVHGPTEQGQWLQAMGIEARTNVLCESLKAKDDVEGLKRVRQAVERLTERGGGAMGKIYKVMAVVPERSGRAPVGFGGSL